MANQYFVKLVLFLVLTGSGICTIHAQKKDEADKKTVESLQSAFLMEKMLLEKQYVFKAQTFLTTSSGTRQLTPNEYDIRLKKDSLIVFLPYFGQSYSAQMSRVDGDGIKLASNKFDYSAVEKKNGKWLVSIKPKDSREVQLLYLTIFNNGAAMLQVTSTNREPMTYNGYVMAQ